MKKWIIRIGIVLLIVGGVYLLLNFTPLKDLVDFEKLFNNKDELLTQVHNNYQLAVIIFIAVYIGAVAFSIPGAFILSILGGFFFTPLQATIYINIGATTGAMLIFLAARFIFGRMLQEKYADKLEKFNSEIDKNGANYLLSMRLIPLFPFFLVNLLPGLTKIPVFTFFWTTALGIIPGSFVYAYLGYSVAAIDVSQGIKMPIEVIFAFVFLGLLSLIPVAIKKIGEKKDG